MKKCLSRFVISVFVVLPQFMFTQTQLYGVLHDAKTQDPIPFANVFFLSNQGRGGISNQNGEFLINFYEQDRSDQLVISQLGYENYRLELKSISKDTVYIQMTPSFHALQEITVISDRGLRGVVKEALRRIPENYGTKKYLLEGFYREYSISDSVYAEVIEAFVKVQDGRYVKPKKKSKMFWDAMRRSDDQRNLPKRLQRADQNLLYSFYERSNPIRRRFFHFVKPGIEGFMDGCHFFNRGEFLENKDTLIRIGFVPKWFDRFDEKIKASFGFGELLINKSDFGIIKISRGDSGLSVYNEAIYEKHGQKYFLSSLQTALALRYDNKTRHYRNARQLHIYRVHPVAAKVKKKGKRLPRYKQLREMKYPYDPSIWEANPFMVELPAQEALEADLSRIKKMEDQFRENAKKVETEEEEGGK